MSALRRRLPWLGAAALTTLVVLEARLAILTTSTDLASKADDNALRTRRMDAPRGRVLDRNGVVLAAARPAVDLMVTPSDVADADALHQTLAPVLGVLGEERLADALASTGLEHHRAWAVVRDLPREARAYVAVRAHALPGVRLRASQLRSYSAVGAAPHAIGYVAEVTHDDLQRLDRSRYRAGDQTGRQGIERLLERELRGVPGYASTPYDTLGHPAAGRGPWADRLAAVAASWDSPVQAGATIRLTLDTTLQQAALDALGDARGAAVALDVHTGAVLLYASSPTFDTNALVSGVSREQWSALQTDPAEPLLDRVSRGLYPPASTFKLVTAAAALESGLSARHTETCTGGLRVGRRRFKCWKHAGHGVVDLMKALKGSCDVWFYAAGLRVGVDKLGDAARRFGLGAPTGLALNGERSGLVPDREWMQRHYHTPWTLGDTASASIGQSINLATPLQLAAMVATVAGNGLRPVPYVVESVTRADGSTAHIGGHTAPIDTGFTPEIMRHIQRGMEAVVASGTAHRSAIDGLPFAGKTGTAQTVSAALKRERPGYDTQDHALFVAYAPVEDPQIALAVVLEHAGGGSSHAAPVARQILRTWAIQQRLIAPPEGEPGPTTP